MHRLGLALVIATLLPARTVLGTTAAQIPCHASSPAPGPCLITTTVNVTAGSTLDFGTRGVVVAASGTLDAGGGSMFLYAGSVVLQPGALLVSAGARIDVIAKGPIQVQAADTKAKIDVSGPSGGLITLDGDGDVVVAGQLIAMADLVQGDGGALEVNGSSVTITDTAKLAAMGGRNGFGGDVAISAIDTNVVIAGLIDTSSGNDGGYISIDADDDVTTTADAVINGKAGEGGSADSIDITAFTGGASLAGTIDASAGGSLDLGGGSGGDVTVDAITTISSTATIEASGGGPDALGGSVEFTTEGDIVVHGPITASAPGTGGYGGLADFTTTDGLVDLGDDVDVSGASSGGNISAFSFNTVRIVAGRLIADGPNSSIDLQGCTVSVAAIAKLSSLGALGDNTVSASGQMTIAGPLVAGRSNRLEYRDPAQPPFVFFPPAPDPTLAVNPDLIPCGGPVTTTTTSTTSTTTTTLVPPTTTTTSVPTTTTTTTLIGPGTTTTTIGTPTTTTATSTTTLAITTSTTTSTTSSTTSTTTTTTTTTTTAAPTTTTTSTAAPSTTTTQPPATTTTTTEPAVAVCTPAECTDGDDCTDDRCDPVRGCLNVPRPGLDLVSCRLDVLATSLLTAPVDDLGGPKARARYSAKVGKARRMVEAARRLKGNRYSAKLRRANRLLAGFTRAIEKAEQRGKMRPELAARLIGLVAGAESSLLPLTQ
ncbi:MAG TPA: hypothetical protein VKA21_03690 [Candidatus Binatia bacterium]|nr:hypothetical protein [Candidatus Binatia bacterium]